MYKRSVTVKNAKYIKASLSVRKKNLCVKQNQNYVRESEEIRWFRYNKPIEKSNLRRKTYKHKDQNRPQISKLAKSHKYKYHKDAVQTDCCNQHQKCLLSFALNKKDYQNYLTQQTPLQDDFNTKLILTNGKNDNINRSNRNSINSNSNIQNNDLNNKNKKSIFNVRRGSKFKTEDNQGQQKNALLSRNSIYSRNSFESSHLSRRQSRRNSINDNNNANINNLGKKKNNQQRNTTVQSKNYRPSIFKKYLTKSKKIIEQSKFRMSTEQQNYSQSQNKFLNQSEEEGESALVQKFLNKQNKQIRKRKFGQLNMFFKQQQQQQAPKQQKVIKQLDVKQETKIKSKIDLSNKSKEIINTYRCYAFKSKDQYKISNKKQEQEQNPMLSDKQKRYLTDGDDCLLPREYALKYTGTAKDFIEQFYEVEKQRKSPIFQKYINDLVKEKIQKKRPFEKMMPTANLCVPKRLIEYIGKSSQSAKNQLRQRREVQIVKDDVLVQRGFGV